ncbi:protein mono-ADP-ribosyltransferase PARP12-like [Triplophysa dalaica]|uniref:protein mono-ADP-ribosyltransferase PARP12-like n=1 Tax=Triplophysa dalaica TaxID=1582913 RepID=UPI0024E005F8|nr:protein mono-ADP-ribosyltransferase PARP12-like [Triplophysa dalaica]
MMAKETLLKILCGNNGAMEYERVLDLSYGLPELSDLDQVIKGDIFTVIQHNDSKEIIVKADVKLCNNNECDGDVCGDLHLCKYELMMGHCSRRVCVFGHELMSKHNIRVLRDHQISALSKEELCVMLLQSDSNLLPPVCVLYNRSGGPYGRCPEKEQCRRLHMCESFITGRCTVTDCGRSHDFHRPDTLRILRQRGVSDDLMSSLPFIYRNILMLKRHGNIRPKSDLTGTKKHIRQRRRNTESDICLSFVKGFCKLRECNRIHFKMPYKWEVKVGDTWAALPNNQQLEREYCEPSNINSSGTEPVCFEDMTLGLDEVRRLSTEPSVLFPSFILTTTWIWYWRDQYDHWVQYSSLKEMHRLCTVCSDDLEKRYQQFLQQQNPSLKDDVVRFRAGKHFYQLNFKDMIQRNEESGTERPVRRRPVFVSSGDVHISRTRKNISARPHVLKCVPGFWDQSAIPDCGFQRVRLHPSDRDYGRVQDLFCQTMSSFTIRQIERVQNRELWGIFNTKKEDIKKTNQERFGERLLFHDAKSSLLDVVCSQNFDIEMSETSAYGKGIYFSKEAQSCHRNTDVCGVRMMFVCRVLLGHYTTGTFHYRSPPPKISTGGHYHSCVDNLRDPSVFVLFDRSQIYPEFLITYEQNEMFEMSLMAGVAHLNVKNVREIPESSDVGTNPSSGIKSSPPFASAPGSEQTSGSSSSSSETHSLSALSGSTIKTNLILSAIDSVSNVPKSDLDSLMMMLTDEIPLLTPLQPAVQLHAGRLSNDPEHQNIPVESVKRSSSENIPKVPEMHSGSVTSSSSGTIQDISEIRSGSAIRSSPGTIPDVSEIRSGSAFGSSPGTIQHVSEIHRSSVTSSSPGKIQDIFDIRSDSAIHSSSGTIQDVFEICSGSAIRSSPATIQHVSAIRSGSAILSSSGHIHDVPEVGSGSVSLSQLRSDSRDSLSKVVQYSNHAVKLPSPPVAANRSSVSDGGGVSSAQSLSRSSGSVLNSSALSSRQTVGLHYSRENPSSIRHESAERTQRDTTTKTTTRTTTEEKKCTVM